MQIPRLAAGVLVLVLVLAGGWYVLLRDDSDSSAAKPVPAVVSTPKQVKQILRATAKQTRTKVTVRSGRSGSATRLVDTAERVVASSLYDKVHYRYLQLGDDIYSPDDGRSCYLHAKQSWEPPLDSATSRFLPAGKTTVIWSYMPAGTRRPTAMGTVVADADTHLMLSTSGKKSVAGTAVIGYGNAVAVPGSPATSASRAGKHPGPESYWKLSHLDRDAGVSKSGALASLRGLRRGALRTAARSRCRSEAARS